MKKYEIPVSDENKKLMFKALNNGLVDFKSHFENIHSSFNNGYGLVSWSFIYNRIYHDTPSANALSLKAKRGGWPIAFLLDKETGFLYAFVKKKNFIHRQKTVNRNRTLYYLQGLSSFNRGMEFEIPTAQLNPHQVSMDLGMNQSEKDNMLTSILHEYKEQVKRFCIVLFDTYKDEIVEFGAVLTNENLDDFYEENWNNIIEVDYKDINNTQITENDQHDIPLEFNIELDEVKESKS